MKALFNDSTKAFVKYGGSTAGIVGIFTDVLTPLAKIGVWCFVIFTILAFCIFLIGRAKTNLFETRDDALKTLWYAPLSFCMLFIAVSTLTIYQINEATQKPNGTLSESSALIKGLQSDLGILKDIDKKLERIAQQNDEIVSNTKSIEENTKTISATTEDIKTNTQTTADVLINQSFNEYDFIKALSDAKSDRLEQYLSPKHWSSTYINPMMTGQIFYAFKLLENKEPRVKDALKLFHEKGLLEPNKLYNHSYPLGVFADIFKKDVSDKNSALYAELNEKYIQREEEIKAYKAKANELSREQAKLLCDKENSEREKRNELAESKWQKKYDESLDSTRQRVLKQYEDELKQHDEFRKDYKLRKAEFDKKSRSDFKSHDDWFKVYSSLQEDSLKVNRPPTKPRIPSYPDNLTELHNQRPKLEFGTCNVFTKQNEIKAELMKKSPTLLNRPTPVYQSYGKSQVTLARYAKEIGNIEAAQYLESIQTEQISISLKIYDYEGKLVYSN